jgi:hypothetical protein
MSLAWLNDVAQRVQLDKGRGLSRLLAELEVRRSPTPVRDS